MWTTRVRVADHTVGNWYFSGDIHFLLLTGYGLSVSSTRRYRYRSRQWITAFSASQEMEKIFSDSLFCTNIRYLFSFRLPGLLLAGPGTAPPGATVAAGVWSALLLMGIAATGSVPHHPAFCASGPIRPGHGTGLSAYWYYGHRTGIQIWNTDPAGKYPEWAVLRNQSFSAYRYGPWSHIHCSSRKYRLTQALQNGNGIRNSFPFCMIGYFKLYAMKVHSDNSFHWCRCHFWNTASLRLFKSKLYNFLLLCWPVWIFVPFRYFTCLRFQTAYVVIELTWLYAMIQAPGFIRETAGTAFFDNVKPFFIRSSGMSFQSKSLQFKRI